MNSSIRNRRGWYFGGEGASGWRCAAARGCTTIILVTCGLLALATAATRASDLAATQDSLHLVYNQVDAAQFPWIVSLVTVTNARGLIIGKLDENNFEVQEDGVRELPILVEELPEGEAGIHVVLTIDCSQSMSGQPIADAKTAATTFVGLMQKLDRSAIVSFNQTPWTEHPFSDDVESLKKAIAQIYATGYTAVYDAVVHSVELITDDMKNRAIILLTDGADNRSRHSFHDALNALLAHEIRAYTIGLGLTPNSNEENVLKDLASQSGGLYFYSPTSSQLEEIYRAISQLLHHRYRVSYTTHNPAKDSTLRHVRIEVLVNGNASADTSSYRAPFEPAPIPPMPPVVPPVNPPIEPPVIPAPEPVWEVIPNPFTPNGDGINDQVEFRYGDSFRTDWSIFVLDRSGRIIRQLANGVRLWNGSDERGAPVLPGCYLYLITNDKQPLHRGLIQLIR